MITPDAVNLLLIDDDEDEYILVRDLLTESERCRFTVDWVGSFDAGRAHIARESHDVYLIDYFLDRHNGLELIREAVAGGTRRPLIMLSGHGDDRIDEEAMRLGAADYLLKSQIGQVHSVLRRDRIGSHGDIVRGQVGAPLLERSILHALERTRIQNRLRAVEQAATTICGTLPSLADALLAGSQTPKAAGRAIEDAVRILRDALDADPGV